MRNHSIFQRVVLILIGSTLSTDSLVFAQATVGFIAPLPAQVQPALQAYIDTDCALVDKERRRDSLAELLALAQRNNAGDLLTDHLIMRLEHGPDKDALRAGLEEEWEERNTFLKTTPHLGLKPEQFQKLKGVDKETYVQQRTEEIKLRLLEKSALALKKIDSLKARAALERAERADPALRELLEDTNEQSGTHDGPDVTAPAQPANLGVH